MLYFELKIEIIIYYRYNILLLIIIIMSSNTFTINRKPMMLGSSDNPEDKFSRCGNKGIIGYKIPKQEYIEEGKVSENTISPFSMAERITLDYLLHNPNITTEELLIYFLHLRINHNKSREKIDNNTFK
uniref:Uncharacterized protein n=1 Tax=Moumouvirus sp. 'Monve' TaxID=1128131 RepID=H2EFA0_9VIRU|nr:hypothetical protein mv_R963 [Moumouvirus Monve]